MRTMVAFLAGIVLTGAVEAQEPREDGELTSSPVRGSERIHVPGRTLLVFVREWDGASGEGRGPR